MMSGEKFSDEMLMRFADGELDADEMAVVEQAMDTDEDLVSRVAMFMETKAHAQAALKPLLDEPVPHALQAAVEGMVAAKRTAGRIDHVTEAATVVPFHKRRDARLHRRWALPLAASIAAAVVGGLAGYWAGRGNPQEGSISLAGTVDRALSDALETIPAGNEAILAKRGRFKVIASFRDGTDSLCREFELDAADSSTAIAVACHAVEGWRVSFMVAAPAETDGYAPASSTEALDAYLTAIEAGEPLSADDEIRALAAFRSR